jgi:hypothetical protein
MVVLGLSDGSTITATDYHPFWDASTSTFTDAIDLPVGDQLLADDGRYLTITSEHTHVRELKTYDLTVDGIHTYYAGTTPVLVHNDDFCFSLATKSDEAVLYSGLGEDGAGIADRWASKNAGATLQSMIARAGVKVPEYDRANPASVTAWRAASKAFADGARGDVRVLQDTKVRVDSNIWREVEYKALKANPHVTSITAINPRTGATHVLWKR